MDQNISVEMTDSHRQDELFYTVSITEIRINMTQDDGYESFINLSYGLLTIKVQPVTTCYTGPRVALMNLRFYKKRVTFSVAEGLYYLQTVKSAIKYCSIICKHKE
jgi:hypothetical protein